MSITEKLTGLISEITQLEKDNKTLNEQLLDLEKDKTEGYKSFDTETHILVEKEFLKGICGAAEDASYEAEQAREEADRACGYAEDAGYKASEASESMSDIVSDIKQIMKGDE